MEYKATPVSSHFQACFDKFPAGFRFGAVNLRVRGALWKRPDVALVVADTACTTAAAYTKNAVQAAPVRHSRKLLAKTATSRALVINSGNANACTGAAGERFLQTMLDAAASVAQCDATEVHAMSTGVIGRVPDAGVWNGLAAIDLGTTPAHFEQAARAICTTDRYPKAFGETIEVDGKIVTLALFGKGAGMIDPALATMLVWIGTDAKISAGDLQVGLDEALGQTLNRISVDGDMSTNDTVLMQASGASGVGLGISHPSWPDFVQALTTILRKLGKAIVRDGEGSNHCIEFVVEQATSDARASEIARHLSRSQLIKTAIFGRDPNWGRVAASVGAIEHQLDPDRLRVSFAGTLVFADGTPEAVDWSAISQSLADEDVVVQVQLGMGDGQASFWSSDLGYEYVRINAEYTT